MRAADTPPAATPGPDLQAPAVTLTGPGVISPQSSCSPECRHDLHSQRDNSKSDENLMTGNETSNEILRRKFTGEIY